MLIFERAATRLSRANKIQVTRDGWYLPEVLQLIIALTARAQHVKKFYFHKLQIQHAVQFTTHSCSTDVHLKKNPPLVSAYVIHNHACFIHVNPAHSFAIVKHQLKFLFSPQGV